MSLHCPATLVLVPADAAPTAGLLATLSGLRIAAAYGSADGAGPWAAALTRLLGAAPRELPGLAGTDPEQSRRAVETIADLHRGEHVLALVPAGWFPTVVVRLAPSAADPTTGPAVLECGDHGWFLRAWPGAPDTPGG